MHPEELRATEEDETPTTAAELLLAAPPESEFGEKSQDASAKASTDAATRTDMVLISIYFSIIIVKFEYRKYNITINNNVIKRKQPDCAIHHPRKIADFRRKSRLFIRLKVL
ncbi:MAG: hypothetical protein WCS54_01635 [Fibrobacteraceae bacterium]